jgi:hypothetical protein
MALIIMSFFLNLFCGQTRVVDEQLPDGKKIKQIIRDDFCSGFETFSVEKRREIFRILFPGKAGV